MCVLNDREVLVLLCEKITESMEVQGIENPNEAARNEVDYQDFLKVCLDNMILNTEDQLRRALEEAINHKVYDMLTLVCL